MVKDKIMSYCVAPIMNKKPHSTVSVQEVYDSIVGNVYANRTKNYRQLLIENPDSQEAFSFKSKNFDYITPSGEFSYVSNSNLEKHSSVICFDFDKLDDLEEVKNILKNDRNIPTLMLFVSPSGSGVKWFVRCKIDQPNDHLTVFAAVESYMKTAYGLQVDQACKDIARACYLCYDSEAFLDPDAKPLSKAFVDQWTPEAVTYVNTKTKTTTDSGQNPWELFNQEGDVHSVLRDAGYTFIGATQTGDKYKRPSYDGNNEYTLIVFRDTNMVQNHSSNDPNFAVGAYSPAAVFTQLVCGGDWKKSTKALRDLGFVKYSQSIKNIFESEERKKERALERAEAREAKAQEKELEPWESDYYDIPDSLPVFWTFSDKKRMKPEVDQDRLATIFSRELNIWRCEEATGDIEGLIEIRDKKVVKEVRREKLFDLMKSFVLDCFEGDEDNIFYRKLINQINQRILYRATAFVLNIPELTNVKFKKDDEHNIFLFFQDCVAKISKKRVDKIPYHEIDDGYIWEKDIIPRNFPLDLDYKSTDFYKYVRNVNADKDWRIKCLMTSHGYLVHNFKIPSKAKAVVLIDEKLTEDLDAAHGGTGKSLSAKLASLYRAHTYINGNDFLGSQAQFKYTNVNPNTKIVWVDEIPKKGLDASTIYGEITNDFSILRKNKDPFIIPFQNSPKFVVSTNRPFKGQSDSDTRRQNVVEFAPFYSKKRGVADDFGYDFFNASSPSFFWEGCDKYIIACAKLYLEEGLQGMDLNYSRKVLMSGMERNMYRFLEDYFDVEQEYTLTKFLNGNPTLDGFKGINLTDFSLYNSNRNKVLKDIESWATFKGYRMNIWHNGKGDRCFKLTPVEKDQIPHETIE
jgi:hypothetical protein